MRKIWGEVLFEVKKTPSFFIVLVVQLVIYFVVSLFSVQLRNEEILVQEKVLHEQQQKKYYNLIDNLVGEYETAFFNNTNALSRLKIMYSMLADNPNFEYLEIYDNPIVLIGDNIRDEVLCRYEMGEAEKYRGVENGEIYNEVKCFWISSNVGDSFDMECQEGTIWKETEKNNEPVPIVLGSEYSNDFHVGDLIEGITPINSEICFEVCGILEEGEYVIYNDRFINLDRYVLIPLQDAKNIPVDEAEERSQIILYLFKINGTLYSSLSADELQTLVQEICITSGVMPSSVVAGAANAQSYIINESTQNVIGILEQMLVLLNFYATIATILFIFIKIQKNSQYYGILVLNGFSLKEIMWIILNGMILLFICAGTIAVLLYSIIAFIVFGVPELHVGQILFFCIETMILSCIISYSKLRKLDVVTCIGGL